MGNDRTVASFPTYAELTQTSAWRERVPDRISSVTEAVAAVSHGSRYTESAVLGVGGMGKVLLARDERIGRDIALKLLHAEHELSPEERERFLREAQVQGQLEHPSIVPVYDVDQREDGTTFFTMRRVLGKTLSTILDELKADVPEARARYTQRELLQAFATVCLAVDYAHSRGVVHRDIKPSNIMLGDFGEVYVLDWGLARIISTAEEQPDPSVRLSLPGAIMGTPLYMAPEQMGDPAVGPAADVFSLGAILFEILTLQRLRDARAIYAPVEARPSLRAPDRAIAPELETICVRATALELTERYPSARALQESVVRYLEGDRELASRRALAAKHVERAREALAKVDAGGAAYEEHRTAAMRELVRALALDPTDRENVATFARIMQAPPHVVPAEVQAEIQASSQAMIHTGAKFSVIAMGAWFCFLPVIMALGIRRVDYLLTAAIPAALTGLMSFVAWRQQTISRAMQVAVVTVMMFAAMSLSRMYGPMILVPTLLATWSVIMQAHPEERMRLFGLASGVICTALPVVGELVGLLPSSYLFDGERMQIVPQMHDLPRDLSLAFLLIANIATCILPALFIARLRRDLARAQRRELVQTWHFRRLGDDLVRAAT